MIESVFGSNNVHEVYAANPIGHLYRSGYLTYTGRLHSRKRRFMRGYSRSYYCNPLTALLLLE